MIDKNEQTASQKMTKSAPALGKKSGAKQSEYKSRRGGKLPRIQQVEALVESNMLRSDEAGKWNSFADVFASVMADLVGPMDYTGGAAEYDGFINTRDISRFCYALRLFGQATGSQITVTRSMPPFYDLGKVSIEKLIDRLRVAHEILVFVDDGRETVAARYLTCRPESDHQHVLSARSPQRRIYSVDDVREEAGIDVEKVGNLLSNNDYSCDFDIDFVYTWVNGEDPEWRKALLEHTDAESVDWDRYTQTDELRYSLRSVFIYASWARRIYVVSNCAPPDWFVQTDRIRWVDHSEIIPNEHLPTFNSHVIEAHLHHIEDLSEHFVYMNDDVFLMTNARPTDFFQTNGTVISHMEAYGSLASFVEMQAIGKDMQEWQLAALRGAELIHGRFGRYPLQLHQHSPHSLKRSVMEQVVEAFPDAFEHLYKQRFRSEEDVSPTSFLHHHFAYHTREAVRDATQFSRLVRANNYDHFLVQLEKHAVPPTICINDGGDSFANKGFQRFKRDFMAKRFPIAPDWEANS